jgi:sirohydrochlorin ferrochelatase
VSDAAFDALIVFAHGSRVAEANDAVRRVAAAAAALGGFSLWRESFLELAPPTLADSAAELANLGARRIVVVPYFLVMGVHLRQDLPRLLAEASVSLPGVELVAAPPLDGHPGLAEILAERAREAAQGARISA